MEKFIVVSTTDNPDYYSYAPFIEKAWSKYGWTLCVMVTHGMDIKKLQLKDSFIIELPIMEGLRDATIAQAGRLYAANYLPKDSLIMTSDMDLLPLSDYWHPKEDEITVFGHDLTDRTYIPMGYVAMPTEKWQEVMNLTFDTKRDLLRDVLETKIAFSDKWEEWWNVDWDLLTKRLVPYMGYINFKNRGRRLTGTYAYGRVDRGDGCKIPPNETLIDMHCENNNVRHPDKWNNFIKIFESLYGKL